MTEFKDPPYLVEVADGDRGKINLIEGSGGVADCDCWALLGKNCIFLSSKNMIL